MRRALEIVLVVVALLGLFGQTVTVVASPIGATAVEVAAVPAMPIDCLQGKGDDSIPCDRMTLACVAGMGCAMPFTLDIGQPVVAEAMMDFGSRAWPSASSLEGRSAPPEPHPPNILS